MQLRPPALPRGSMRTVLERDLKAPASAVPVRGAKFHPEMRVVATQETALVTIWLSWVAALKSAVSRFLVSANAIPEAVSA